MARHLCTLLLDWRRRNDTGKAIGHYERFFVTSVAIHNSPPHQNKIGNKWNVKKRENLRKLCECFNCCYTQAKCFNRCSIKVLTEFLSFPALREIAISAFFSCEIWGRKMTWIPSTYLALWSATYLQVKNSAVKGDCFKSSLKKKCSQMKWGFYKIHFSSHTTDLQ